MHASGIARKSLVGAQEAGRAWGEKVIDRRSGGAGKRRNIVYVAAYVLGVVENVEDAGAEFEGVALGDVQPFLNREIYIVYRRKMLEVTAAVHENAGSASNILRVRAVHKVADGIAAVGNRTQSATGTGLAIWIHKDAVAGGVAI